MEEVSLYLECLPLSLEASYLREAVAYLDLAERRCKVECCNRKTANRYRNVEEKHRWAAKEH